MRFITQLFVTLALLGFIAACSDQMIAPEQQSGSVGQASKTAVPFQVDMDAVLPGISDPYLTASKSATTTCTFTTVGTTMFLDADCTTDATIFVPDGMTLHGDDYTITAVDPVGGFLGPVVANAGETAHVRNLTVTTSGLANLCKGGADRLRGIMFEGASGSITHNMVIGINKGASGCQEGNGIEVRNAPFDGTHPATDTVEVSHNQVLDWQKTGIVANGDVHVNISLNQLSASATQANLAANSIQLGFGALGIIELNNLEGNQWLGTSDFAASGILVFATGAVAVTSNKITGNSDVGLFVLSDGGLYEKNLVEDMGADDVNSGYDIGIGNYGTGNTYNKNRVSGFDMPFDPDPLPGDKNKVLF